MIHNNKLRELRFVWKNVFSKQKYIALSIIVSILFFLANAIIVQLSLGNFKLKEAIYSPLTLYYFTTTLSFYSTITISLLTGVLLSLIVFKAKNMDSSNLTKANLISSIGVFLGALVPGCAACGVGIISFLGLTSALFYLPFKGTEISIAAILIILFAIYHTTIRLLECNKIKLK